MALKQTDRQRAVRRWLFGWAITVTAPLVQSSTLVLVSIDGFRHDYLDIHSAPALSAIAEQGFRVRYLEPVYPPNTFPGHISLITGLPPEQHGIADNHFCHRERGQCYHMGDGGRDGSWLGGMPLWNLVEAHGLKAATYFWPESDAQWGGRTPSYFFHYAKQAPYEQRVRQVIEWLSLPEPARPSLITLYFSAVDTAGHRYGPRSPETAAAVAQVDAHIGQLWQQIQSLRDPDVSLLLVSDHGMAEIEAGSGIPVASLPSPSGFERLISRERVRYFPTDAAADEDELVEQLAQLAEADERWQLLDREATLAMGGYSASTVPTASLLTRPPHFFARAPMPAGRREGSHGFPLDVTDMGAFAVGIGPAFAEAVTVERAHQLDVYPVVARVLGLEVLTPVASDGGTLLGVLPSAELNRTVGWLYPQLLFSLPRGGAL